MQDPRLNARVLAADPPAALLDEWRRAGAAEDDVARLAAATDLAGLALENVAPSAVRRLAEAARRAGAEAVHPAGPGPVPVVLTGTRTQLRRTAALLGGDPYAEAVGAAIEEALAAWDRRTFQVPLGSRRLVLGPRVAIVGVVNVTPDSFSDGGRYLDPQAAVAHGRRLVAEGADLLDVGGESTRPGSRAVSEEEELARVLPVVESLAAQVDVPLSIDTRHARVAREAVAAGAAVINDVTGFQGDPEMARAAAETGAAVVLMHIRGEPRTMQDAPRYDHLAADVCRYLRRSLRLALDAGVAEERLIVDPGIGFGKTLEHNLALLANLGQLRTLGRPILAGPSRKRFIGQLAGVEAAAERGPGTVAACALAVAAGALLVRVHDVAAARQALAVASAIAGVARAGVAPRTCGSAAP